MQLSLILNLSLWTLDIENYSVISALEFEWNDDIIEEIDCLREVVAALVMHFIFLIKSHPSIGI